MKTDWIALRLLGQWSVELGLGSVLLRLALSLAFSAIIGCERSSKRHSAGLRTFILVSLAGTGTMLIDEYLMQQFGVPAPLLSAAAVTGAPGYTLLAQAEELPAAAHLVYITNDTVPDTAAQTALRRFGTLRILYCGDEPTPDGVHFDAVQYARQLETLTI